MNVDLILLLKLILMVGCVFLSAVFSGTETGMFSIGRIKLLSLNKKSKKEQLLVKLLSKPDRLIISILFGNMLVNVFSTTISEGVIRDLTGLEPGNIYSNIITVFIMAFIILVFGEITPKSIAIRNPVKISLKVVKFINFIHKLAYPFYLIIKEITGIIINVFSKLIKYKPSKLTEDELKMAIELGLTDGTVDKKEELLIKRVFDYSKTKVKEIMCPRKDIVLVSKDDNFSKLIRIVDEKRYSKMPVYDNKLDNIIGLIYAKDLIINRTKIKNGSDWLKYLREPIYVPETKSASSLLKEFKNKKIHIAIVVDEYGGLAGLVTLEDILEEIFGNISDREEGYSNYIKRVSSNRYKIKGRMEIDYFNNLFKTDIDAEKNITIAGFIMEKLGRIAKMDDKIVYKNVTFILSKVKGTEITEIIVEKT